MSNVGAIGVFVGIILICFVIIGLAVLDYVLVSLGLYKIAKRRQIDAPWLAWIPIGSDWIIGSITADYDKKNGLKSKWQKVLLALSLISLGGAVVLEVVIYVAVWFLMVAAGIAQSMGNGSESILTTGILIILIGLFVVAFVVSVIETAANLCRQVCYFKIFESAVPQKALKYLLLSYMIPLVRGICLLKCKDKEPSETLDEELQI